MYVREFPLEAEAPEERRARAFMAAVLRGASRALDALAERLALVEAPAAEAEPVLEFHGDAAAPEGALYVNGQLVGHVLGVSRL
jgi:hypothetical protein